ncbi:MAG: polyprenyl synthetase family protein [Muribaculaceae bacterium]|nr:polyprenyl synthetase family protein [Muribaculaceae bacterium]
MIEQEKIAEAVDSIVSSYTLPESPAGLYKPIEYALDCGGKRLRPTLLLAACVASGGNMETAASAALGIEMFHNFTLLHDDVMDRADMRRGRPTVHVKWNDVTAILSGDAMLTLSGQLMAQVPDIVLRAVLDMYNRTAMEVYEGQQYDMDFESRSDVKVEEYMHMIRLKTSVLLAASCYIGALAGGADTSAAGAFYEYGVNLGLAFQLRDDWLDTYGDPAVFGKKIGGDIVNRKKTWLLISALRDRREELSDILAEDLEADELIRQVKAVYDSLRLSEKCDKLITEYARKAVAALDNAGISDEDRTYFAELAMKLSSRNK